MVVHWDVSGKSLDGSNTSVCRLDRLLLFQSEKFILMLLTFRIMGDRVIYVAVYCSG